jgi:fibronectin-binding autotransporter adhesin
MSAPPRAPARAGTSSGTGTGAMSLTAENSTIAGNTGVTSQAGGIDIGTGTGTGACSGLINGVNGDQVNVPSGLPPPASNGGPTNTAALAPTSPAIGAGNPTTCAQAPISGKDQRGHSRNATTRGGCDIGAYDTGGAS